MVLAATLVAAVGAASARTLKAEIPLTFRANGAVMTAGTYRVTLSHCSLAGVWTGTRHRLTKSHTEAGRRTGPHSAGCVASRVQRLTSYNSQSVGGTGR